MGGCLSSQSDNRSISRHHKPFRLRGLCRRSVAPVSPSGNRLRDPPIPNDIIFPDSYFLCSSDQLHFDDYIPPLNPDDELVSAQIYFILPNKKLQYRLAAADLAALAVKASVALDQINASNHRRKRKSRISPVSTSDDDNQGRQSNQTVNNNNDNNIKPLAVDWGFRDLVL